MLRLILILGIFIIINIHNTSAQYIDFEEGIVAYYPFNGSAEDKTGGGNDGFVNGATLTVDRFGNANGAYKFDGRSQSIRIPFSDIINFTNRQVYSISLWIKPRDTNTGCIIMKNFDFGIKWGGMNEVCTIYSGIASSFMKTNKVSWNSNTWYNLVIVQAPSKILFYVDGKLNYSANRPHETSDRQEDIFIGRHPYFWGAFEGVMDDICIFERPLNQLEVEALYQIEQMPLQVIPKKNIAPIDASNLSGTWQGIFSQPGNINFNSYAFWVDIKVDGEQVTGYSRTEIANSKAYGIMNISGGLSQTTLSIRETQLLREVNPSALDWCKKFTNLRYNPKDKSLRGRWLSDNCKENGEVVLFKSKLPFNFYANKQGTYASMEEIKGILVNNKNKPKEEKKSLVNRKIEINPITFVFGSGVLSAKSQNYLINTVVPFMNEVKSLKFRVEGHTDNVGDDGTNLQLSLARAKAVVNFLVLNGIQRSRLAFEGFGESKPITENQTQEGRRENRRVEINIEDE